MDAVALLKADHRLVENLIEKFEKSTRNENKQKIAQQICLELSVHAMIEEEIFYRPARASLKKTSSTKPMLSTTCEGADRGDRGWLAPTMTSSMQRSRCSRK